MFESLNARTREILTRLATGQTASLGGKTVGPFNANGARMLCILAEGRRDLTDKTGADLADEAARQFGDTDNPDFAEPVAPQASAADRVAWKVGIIRACSFRGLAPRGETWTYDFAGESHLLYGPNGCGKSSLLGAIAWCLTGRIFRDDCAPSAPASVDIFTAEDRPQRAGTHPDALTLLNAGGAITQATAEYWVELELLGVDEHGAAQKQWIRRHSADGLATSRNGTSWAPIGMINEVGIDEFDAELHVVMPARVPHLRFGENADLVRLFAQMVGLDDLEDISGLADRTTRALKTCATRVNNDIANEDRRITDAIAAISEAATDEIKSFNNYDPAVAASRNSRQVQDFGAQLNEALEEQRNQLACDIGLAIPEEGTPEYAKFKSDLEQLSGRVLAAMDELQKPLSSTFRETVCEESPEAGVYERLAADLDEFERASREQIRERLEWAERVSEDAKADLMLAAAGHFPEESDTCPVCTQDLNAVPDVKSSLASLRPLAGRLHLRKEVDDLQRELEEKLDAIVSARDRERGKETLREKLLKEWAALKGSRFVGLLQRVNAILS